MNSELRQDLVSGDWIVIAPRRARGHLQLYKKSDQRQRAPIKNCPFENPQKTGHGKPILIYGSEKNWSVQIVKNKFPAFIHRNVCASRQKNGPYSVIDGVGYHELLITRDHHKNFPHLTKEAAASVFRAFRDRYLTLLDDPCVAYVSIFHNWGPKAGASIFHPHYQIIGIPVVPPDIEHSLSGSLDYFKKHKKCVHCTMISQEKEVKKRIVYENNEAIVFTPFVSREPFELRIFPKKHLPHFENTPDRELGQVVEALRIALGQIEKKLRDPDYNFFIHTAPLKDKNNYKNYHWHIEVQPKISVSAGFELGTGIEITVVDPDSAAKVLKK